MIKILNFLGSRMHCFYNIGACVFGLFFISQLAALYQFRVENRTIETLIEQRIESIESTNEKLLGSMLEIETYRMRFKENNDQIRPYLHMIESIDSDRIQVSEFGNQLKADLLAKRLYGFDDYLFKDLMSLIKWADDYPQLKEYALSKMHQEILLRAQSLGGVSCCYFGSRPFTIIEKVDKKYHFYPGNYEVPPCDAFIKINGEIYKDDYLWKPTRQGMHYFDIEYIDISNFDVKKKQFRFELKVV